MSKKVVVLLIVLMCINIALDVALVVKNFIM